MKSSIKIIALTLILALFIVVMNYMFSTSLILQFVYFIIINAFFMYSKGWKMFWKLAKYWYKFSFVIIILFGLFFLLNTHFIHYDYICLSNSFECFSKWIMVGIITALLLINTVFTIEIIILAITVNDIISLPIPIKYLKVFILARTLMLQTVSRFEDNELLIKTVPEFQVKKAGVLNNFKFEFHKRIILILTFVFFVLEQSEILGSLIDNRINHNH